MKVLVVGSGLMGGSVGLALEHSGHDVCLIDADVDIQSRARELLRITADEMTDPELVVVAVPPAFVSQVIIDQNRSFPNATFIDIASIMNKPLLEVQASGHHFANWISTHPMAGKEIGGYENASFDLFKDRLWVISPQTDTSQERIDLVKQVIRDCGAIPFEMEASAHDKTVALTSHLPQVLATVLASQLNHLDENVLQVSGQGLRDLTRISSSSGELWNEILIANKEHVIEAISSLQKELDTLKTSLKNESATEIIEHFVRGNKGKLRLPGKHGGAQQSFSMIAIEIDDKPGQLAAIFHTAGKANVNIEDVRIDHALGKEVAIVELFIVKEQKESLREALTADGWKIRSTSSSQ